MHIAIAGAGIGGLSTAIAMARENFTVTVLEKQAEVSEGGAGIQLGPNATRVLQSLDLLEFVKPLTARPSRIAIRDLETASLLSELPLGDDAVKSFGAPYLTIHRADLHSILLRTAQAHDRIRVLFDKPVAQFHDNADAVVVHCEDGEQFEANLIVGADGIWSNVRRNKRFWGSSDDLIDPKPTRTVALRTLVPRGSIPDHISANTVELWIGPALHAVHYPVRGGELINIVLIVEGDTFEDGWSVPVTRREITDAIRSTHPLLQTLCERGEDWRKWAVRQAPVARTMGSGRGALVGDAAHPVLPYHAQGGAMALEDAVTLAGALARHANNLPNALHVYDTARQKRVRRVARASARNGRIYHQSGLLQRARNAVLKAVPPPTLMRSFDWLYGHDATRTHD